MFAHKHYFMHVEMICYFSLKKKMLVVSMCVHTYTHIYTSMHAVPL